MNEGSCVFDRYSPPPFPTHLSSSVVPFPLHPPSHSSHSSPHSPLLKSNQFENHGVPYQDCPPRWHACPSSHLHHSAYVHGISAHNGPRYHCPAHWRRRCGFDNKVRSLFLSCGLTGYGLFCASGSFLFGCAIIYRPRKKLHAVRSPSCQKEWASKQSWICLDIQCNIYLKNG